MVPRTGHQRRTTGAVSEPRARARLFFGDRNPVGTVATTLGGEWEIVGLVDDVRQHLDTDPAPQFYFDFRQLPPIDFPGALPVYFAVHAEGVPTRLVPSVRGLLRQVEPDAALESVATLASLVASSIARPRFYAVIVLVFAMVAVGLATIGIYGVMSYSVAQRTGEIGIQITLGAQRSEVLALVLRQSVVLTVLGVLAGIGGAAALTRYLEGMLYGLTPLDPMTFVAVPLLFAAVASVAALVPARRATRVDPIVALRCE